MTGKVHRITMAFAGMTQAAIDTAASGRQAATAGGTTARSGDRHPSPSRHASAGWHLPVAAGPLEPEWPDDAVDQSQAGWAIPSGVTP